MQFCQKVELSGLESRNYLRIRGNFASGEGFLPARGGFSAVGAEFYFFDLSLPEKCSRRGLPRRGLRILFFWDSEPAGKVPPPANHPPRRGLPPPLIWSHKKYIGMDRLKNSFISIKLHKNCFAKISGSDVLGAIIIFAGISFGDYASLFSGY